MPKKTVKRCIRPQCMEIYEETEKNRFCMCGALLQITEIDIKPKKSTYKKPANTSKPKTDYIPKQDEVIVSVSNEEEINQIFINIYGLQNELTPEVEISDVSEMGKLAIELEKEGFTTTEIEKIYYKNALRVIKDVL